MIEKNIHLATFYSALTMPGFTDLPENSLDLKFLAKKLKDVLFFNIGLTLVMTNPQDSKKSEPLKSESRFELHIKDGLTIHELYGVVIDAVDRLEAFPHASEADKHILFATLEYPPLDSIEKNLKEIADDFLGL